MKPLNQTTKLFTNFQNNKRHICRSRPSFWGRVFQSQSTILPPSRFDQITSSFSRIGTDIDPGGKLTDAGLQRGFALFVSWGAAVTPEAGHPIPAQTLTGRLVAPATHRSQRVALAGWKTQKTLDFRKTQRR